MCLNNILLYFFLHSQCYSHVLLICKNKQKYNGTVTSLCKGLDNVGPPPSVQLSQELVLEWRMTGTSPRSPFKGGNNLSEDPLRQS